MGIRYREFEEWRDHYMSLVRLKEKVYESDEDLAVWKWKYIKNPYSRDIRVFIAESGNGLIASTTRLPVDIRLGGKTNRACFSVDSMVHPQFQRKGIMRDLYGYTAERLPVMYSKGTNPGMYQLLMELGYKEISPNTYLTNYLSPLRLLMKKLDLYRTNQGEQTILNAGDGEFLSVKSFGREFDEFWNRVADAFPGIVRKDAVYMNWRYVDIPHRKYQIFYRNREDRVVILVVMRVEGASCSIVDILWDPDEEDELGRTIHFWVRHLREQNFLKLSCWGTLQPLRASLQLRGFIDRGYTPRFSVYAPQNGDHRFSDGDRIHFVDGDGDSEYLL